MNRTTTPLPPLCHGAGGSGDHRKPTILLPRCAVVDRHHVPLKHSWADAATPAQLDTIPARARASGVSAPVKINNLISKDNREPEGGGISLLSRPEAALAWADFARKVTGLLIRIGDRVFAMNDEEACWRDWEIQRRNAGLGRRYRDARFGPCVQERPLVQGWR